jgi:hypothetical protein
MNQPQISPGRFVGPEGFFARKNAEISLFLNPWVFLREAEEPHEWLGRPSFLVKHFNVVTNYSEMTCVITAAGC